MESQSFAKKIRPTHHINFSVFDFKHASKTRLKFKNLKSQKKGVNDLANHGN